MVLGRRGVLGLVAIVAVAVPFVAVSFPPATDLPQHVAQIRLFGEALSGAVDVYRVDWAAPNNLVYLFVGAGYALFGPLGAGRAALLFLAVATAAGLALLCWRRARPPEAALLAAALVFSPPLYWGFLNFECGWPVFLLWFALTADPAPRPRPLRHALALAGVALLLYASHALWFAVGAVWVVLVSAVARAPRALWLARLTSLVPAGIAAAIWYPSLSAARAAGGFDLAAHWLVPPWERLAPQRLLDAVLGGIRDPAVAIVGVALLAWIALAIVTRWRDLGAATDRRALLAATLFGAIALFAPDKYVNTILFAERWWPCAVAFLLLALPAPRLRPLLTAGVATAVLAGLSAATTASWLGYEREELSGLAESLRALPPAPRLLGLDLVKESVYVKGRPFLQTFALGQALRGGELSFSFAEHASGLVAYRSRRAVPWTIGLEWYAERVRVADVSAFDHVLVNARPMLHERFAARFPVAAITGSGRWRLYRVAASK